MVVIMVIITAVAFIMVILLNDFHVVFKSKWDQLIFKFVTNIKVCIHLFANVLLLFFVIFVASFFAFKGFLVRHLDSLEEIEETFTVYSLGHSGGLALLL